MFCPSCGKEIKDGSKFCKYCGADIKSKKSSPQSSNSSDNSKIIIIGALIAVIVILAVVIGVFGFGLMDSGNNNVSSLDTNNAVGTDDKSSVSSNEPVSLNSFPVSRAPELAKVVKKSNGVFPVKFGSLSLSKAQCSYILTKSVYEIGTGHPDATISVGTPDYAANPSGRDSSQTITSSSYIDMSKRFSSWIESTGAVPNYIGVYTSGVADVSPSRMLDIAVNVLIQYDDTGSLPSSIKI